ncbi:MAG: PAS domain-containing protein, partial [Thermodesulfobacteriota bacterium]|nr:PAS domain-containing protein [Thermodesulfobacteriota bacterium]
MSKRESKKITSIFEAMVDGVYVIDDDFTLEYMNDEMIKNFGEGIGRKCYRVIHEKNEVCAWCRANEVFEGKTIRWEQYIKNLDQTYDLIEFPLKNSDGTISKVSIYRDITQRKKSEERIKTLEEDYRRLFENARSGLYFSTKEGKFINANKALLDMLGYETKDEFLKIDITSDLYQRPEDRRKFQEIIERDGHVTDYEVEFKRKDERLIPVLV